MRQLVEQCMMQFFVAVKARESGQLFLKVYITAGQLSHGGRGRGGNLTAHMQKVLNETLDMRPYTHA